MHFPYKTPVVIGLASVLGIAVIAAAAFLLLRTPSYSPADLVPADRTLIYLEHTGPVVREKLGALVPFLNSLPPGEGSTAALIRHDDGTTDWVVFEKGTTGTAGIRASNPKTLMLIGTGSALSADPAFRTLARGRAGTGSWLFARAAQTDVALPSGLRQPHGPVSVLLLPNETHIAWTTSGMVRPLATGFKDFGTPATLRIHAGDLRAFFDRASGIITDSSQLAYEAALRAWFARTFGQNLSLAYDFAPILEGQASVTLMRTGSGTHALLEGESDDAADRLDALHAGFRNAFGGAQRVERTFDETFNVDNIRAGSDASEASDELNGWTIRSTTRDDKSVHSAVNGRRFILSNNEKLLRTAIETFPEPTVQTAGVSVARGELSREDALILLRTVLPGENLPLPSALLPASRVHWELIRSGDLAVLRVF